MSEPERIVAAKAFHLVDDDGAKRAALQISSDGSPSLEFYDTQGAPRVGLSLNKYGKATLFFWSSEGLPLIEILVENAGDHETPRLDFVDGDGTARARLVMGPRPSLTIRKDGAKLFDSTKPPDEDIISTERLDADFPG